MRGFRTGVDVEADIGARRWAAARRRCGGGCGAYPNFVLKFDKVPYTVPQKRRRPADRNWPGPPFYSLEFEMKPKVIGFASTPQIDKAIKREQKRLAGAVPGSEINRSEAVRSLLVKASTPTEKPKQ